MWIVCAEFDLRTNTFYDIKKNCDEMWHHSLSLEDCGSKVKKRFKPAKFLDLHEVVYKWYKQESASVINVQGVDIQNAAISLTVHLDIENFNAHAGWLFNFRACHCLVES